MDSENLLANRKQRTDDTRVGWVSNSPQTRKVGGQHSQSTPMLPKIKSVANTHTMEQSKSSKKLSKLDTKRSMATGRSSLKQTQNGKQTLPTTNENNNLVEEDFLEDTDVSRADDTAEDSQKQPNQLATTSMMNRLDGMRLGNVGMVPQRSLEPSDMTRVNVRALMGQKGEKTSAASLVKTLEGNVYKTLEKKRRAYDQQKFDVEQCREQISDLEVRVRDLICEGSALGLDPDKYLFELQQRAAHDMQRIEHGGDISFKKTTTATSEDDSQQVSKQQQETNTIPNINTINSAAKSVKLQRQVLAASPEASGMSTSKMKVNRAVSTRPVYGNHELLRAKEKEYEKLRVRVTKVQQKGDTYDHMRQRLTEELVEQRRICRELSARVNELSYRRQDAHRAQLAAAEALGQTKTSLKKLEEKAQEEEKLWKHEIRLKEEWINEKDTYDTYLDDQRKKARELEEQEEQQKQQILEQLQQKQTEEALRSVRRAQELQGNLAKAQDEAYRYELCFQRIGLLHDEPSDTLGESQLHGHSTSRTGSKDGSMTGRRCSDARKSRLNSASSQISRVSSNDPRHTGGSSNYNSSTAVYAPPAHCTLKRVLELCQKQDQTRKSLVQRCAAEEKRVLELGEKIKEEEKLLERAKVEAERATSNRRLAELEQDLAAATKQVEQQRAQLEYLYEIVQPVRIGLQVIASKLLRGVDLSSTQSVEQQLHAQQSNLQGPSVTETQIVAENSAIFDNFFSESSLGMSPTNTVHSIQPNEFNRKQSFTAPASSPTRRPEFFDHDTEQIQNRIHLNSFVDRQSPVLSPHPVGAAADHRIHENGQLLFSLEQQQQQQQEQMKQQSNLQQINQQKQKSNHHTIQQQQQQNAFDPMMSEMDRHKSFEQTKETNTIVLVHPREIQKVMNALQSKMQVVMDDVRRMQAMHDPEESMLLGLDIGGNGTRTTTTTAGVQPGSPTSPGMDTSLGFIWPPTAQSPTRTKPKPTPQDGNKADMKYDTKHDGPRRRSASVPTLTPIQYKQLNSGVNKIRKERSPSPTAAMLGMHATLAENFTLSPYNTRVKASRARAREEQLARSGKRRSSTVFPKDLEEEEEEEGEGDNEEEEKRRQRGGDENDADTITSLQYPAKEQSFVHVTTKREPRLSSTHTSTTNTSTGLPPSPRDDFKDALEHSAFELGLSSHMGQKNTQPRGIHVRTEQTRPEQTGQRSDTQLHSHHHPIKEDETSSITEDEDEVLERSDLKKMSQSLFRRQRRKKPSQFVQESPSLME